MSAHAVTARGLRRFIDDERWLGRLLIAPAVIYIVALVGFPFVLAIYYSLSDATVGSSTLHFVGLRNFRSIMDNPTFWESMRNSIVFTLVSQVLVVVLGNILALALNKDFRGKWLVRFLILLPWVAPISLGVIGWLWIFDPVYSIINWSMRAIGVFGPDTWPIWLGQPNLAMASVIMVDVWRLLPLATMKCMIASTISLKKRNN